MNADVPRAYLDTNVFIAAFENAGAHSDHAWWIFDALERGDIVGVTSEITLAEVLVKPLELGDDDLARGYDQMLVTAPGFEVLPVRRDILLAAADLRATARALKLPDAVHVATALALACDVFVTDDRKVPVPENLRLLQVNPFTVDDIVKPRT